MRTILEAFLNDRENVHIDRRFSIRKFPNNESKEDV